MSEDKIDDSNGQEDYYEKLWKDMDDLIFKSLERAENACRINFAINIVLVAIGVTLLVYAMAYSAIKGLDIYSTAFGSLGVITFVTVFFLTPQSKIEESAGDLAQLQILYRSYLNQLSIVNIPLNSPTSQSLRQKQLQEISTLLESITNNTVDEIEKLVGKSGSTPTSVNGKVKKQNKTPALPSA